MQITFQVIKTFLSHFCDLRHTLFSSYRCSRTVYTIFRHISWFFSAVVPNFTLEFIRRFFRKVWTGVSSVEIMNPRRCKQIKITVWFFIIIYICITKLLNIGWNHTKYRFLFCQVFSAFANLLTAQCPGHWPLFFHSLDPMTLESSLRIFFIVQLT